MGPAGSDEHSEARRETRAGRRELALQERQHLVMKQAVAGYSVTPSDRALALPVGESAVGLLDDRQQRGAVPDVHPWVDHDVGTSCCHQYVPIAVSPGPSGACRSHKAV
ncbi:hypothetical protein LCGC14_3139500 [marine sediment metagenome]|uniref:Uncharacterized protein n=1 Tax=marine sediment metagenome TaxID=412755 RepID=A0A0F8VX93_9ZZZZ